MLVVRVKRYRHDDPAEELYIYEDNAPLVKKKKRGISSQLTALKAIDDTAEVEDASEMARLEAKSRLILRRVSTLDSVANKSLLDNATAKLLHDRHENDQDPQAAPPTKRAKVIVAQGGSRSLPIVGQESCIVVDMMQLTNAADLQEKAEKERLEREKAQPTPSPAKKTKIVDPATRMLGRGIERAVKNGDFTDISDALIQGADATYQIDASKGGYTALMVSAMKTNLRMVKRLLTEANQVVLLRDSQGRLAIDLVKESRLMPNADAQEIKLLLQSAMVKAHKEIQKEKQRDTDMDELQNQGSDFVIDIYCIKKADAMDTDQDSSESTETTENTNVREKVTQPELVPALPTSVVHIEGLRILEDGQVELVSYDSDWSDLADDEEPDSNDERFFANDYPDESDDDNGGGLFRDDDEEEEGPAMPAHESDYDQDDSDEEERQSRRHIRQHKVQFASSTAPTGKSKSRNNVDKDIEDELQRMLGEGAGPLFDRHKSVGRVMRPHNIGENESGGGRMDSEQLRELWGEDAEEFEGEDDELPMKQRIQQMRIRTGMAFASDPREFSSSGLPKYGHDLSDDDNEMMDDGERDARPERTAVAYDSELDQSD